MMKIVEYFVPLVLLAISAVLLGKGWAAFEASRHLVATTETAQGTVVKMVPYLSGKLGKKGSLVYLPKVEFTTTDGRKVQFQSQVSRRADDYREGQQVPVRYPPEKPEKAVIATFAALWALPLIYAAGGLMLLVFGGWFLKRAMGDREAT